MFGTRKAPSRGLADLPPGGRMLSYRFDHQQDDGSWSAHEFWSADDDDAVTFGLSIRTASRCELYQADRWLATFDCVPELHQDRTVPANDNVPSNLAVEVC